jgi:DNA polymerase-3 subunit alpha
MSANGLNKRMLLPLIQAGALDGLDCTRRQMLLHYEEVMDNVGGASDPGIEGQMSLFGEAELTTNGDMILPPAAEYPLTQLLFLEKEACGMYLSGHPLDGFRRLQMLLRTATLSDCQNLPENAQVQILCLLQNAKHHRTKKGEEMAFLTVEDAVDTMDAVVFPKLYAVSAARLHPDKLLYLTGRISRKEEEVSVLCDTIRTQEELPVLLRQMQLCIKISSPADMEKLTALQTLCRENPGDTRVVLYLTARKTYSVPKPPLYAEITEDFADRLFSLFPASQCGLIGQIGRKS